MKKRRTNTQILNIFKAGLEDDPRRKTQKDWSKVEQTKSKVRIKKNEKDRGKQMTKTRGEDQTILDKIREKPTICA